jgi:ABC-2 type transport system ATP-binding protein
MEAVKNVSFDIEKGEIVGFLGSNAAGKTTTMRMLTCYFPPTSGEAKVAGYDIFEQSIDVRRNVGYLPENVPLYTDMPVEYFFKFAAELKGVPSGEKQDKVEKVMTKCGLTHVRQKNIGHLSKGYRQRVGIAQAIINDPPVLILDEPTVGLDPKQIIEIRNLIKSFGGKSTVILSTHILHEIEKVCDRILIIDRGQILAFDTIENLAEKLSTDYSLMLTVEGNSEKVKSALKSISQVTKLQDLGKVEGDTYKYRANIPKDSSIRGVISQKLNDAEFKLVEMYVERMSAEDIFRTMVPDVKEVTEGTKPEGEVSDNEPKKKLGSIQNVGEETESGKDGGKE